MGKRSVEWKMKQEVRRAARRDIERIHSNIITHKPWWLPRFLWRRMVAIVLAHRD